MTAADVAGLTKAWEFDAGAHPLFPAPPSDKANISGPPTVLDGRVFAASANGFVYAFDARSGKSLWLYKATQAQYNQTVPGVYTSVTLTADGRALIGDGSARVHALDQRTGERLWRTSVGLKAKDHVWASPVVSNGKVYVGVASHFDNPCVRGRSVALDLETGDPVWTSYMVPENVCDHDLDLECTTDADCGLGTCIAARGAGVTGLAAIDALGENLYVNTVGCGTFPSLGHSELILKISAETGEVVWASRMAPGEQISHCVLDPSTECGSDAVCGPGDSCLEVPHSLLSYRDYGFIPGPMLIDADDGAGGTNSLVVAAAKEGVLYALDEATGSLVWSNQVFPEPVHGGQGHFSGGVGYADGRFHASLGSFFTFSTPAFQQQAMSAVDGSTLWTKRPGATYSATGIVDGVVLSGSPPGLVAQDPATGAVLGEWSLPAQVQSAPVVVDGMLYVGWGDWTNDTGGLTAFKLD